MMKHEFEALAGYEVSFEDYNRVIEPMYMATELSKEDFVKCIDRKRFALPTKAELLAAPKPSCSPRCGRRPSTSMTFAVGAATSRASSGWNVWRTPT